jgi:hypothetical protein
VKPFWNDRRIVGRTPMLTFVLLEGANLGQIKRLWTERTAEGQSLASWLMVFVALLLWFNFYRVITPDQKWAIRAGALGMALNALVCLSVVYFRWIAR